MPEGIEANIVCPRGTPEYRIAGAPRGAPTPHVPTPIDPPPILELQ